MHILLFIFVFIIAIAVFGLSIVGYLLRAIFGIGRHSSSSTSSRSHQSTSGGYNNGQQNYGQRTQRPTDNTEERHSENGQGKKHKKIFTQDDGEYVDFEEIKE